jgi:hypothetical protein
MGTPSPRDLATAPRWKFFFFHGAGGGDDIKGRRGCRGRRKEKSQAIEAPKKSDEIGRIGRIKSRVQNQTMQGTAIRNLVGH